MKAWSEKRSDQRKGAESQRRSRLRKTIGSQRTVEGAITHEDGAAMGSCRRKERKTRSRTEAAVAGDGETETRIVCGTREQGGSVTGALHTPCAYELLEQEGTENKPQGKTRILYGLKNEGGWGRWRDRKGV